MPLEIWILMMTLFNVFLVTTYLYFRNLHHKTSNSFNESLAKLDRRISNFENKLVSRPNSLESEYEIDGEYENK